MNSEAALGLAHLGLHPDRNRQLVERLGSPAAVLGAISAGSEAVSDAIRQRLASTPTEIETSLARLGAKALIRGTAGYPDHLNELPDSPPVLFVKGELPAVLAVALVGSRRATSYGRRLARRFGQAVAEVGWPVVSGLARGIDIAAHQGCLEAGGVGIGVLGSGLDRFYPAEHRPIGERLVAGGGAIVTEYPLGTTPEGWRFPPRNRIIAGLSAAVVVVEAAVTGGALITANAALSYGRAVLAVPGDIERETSRGCNLLIRDGAYPVLGVDELIEALGFVLGPPRVRPKADIPEEDPLLSALGSELRSPDWLAEHLNESPSRILAMIGRLQALGRIEFDGIVVAAIPGR